MMDFNPVDESFEASDKIFYVKKALEDRRNNFLAIAYVEVFSNKRIVVVKHKNSTVYGSEYVTKILSNIGYDVSYEDTDSLVANFCEWYTIIYHHKHGIMTKEKAKELKGTPLDFVESADLLRGESIHQGLDDHLRLFTYHADATVSDFFNIPFAAI